MKLIDADVLLDAICGCCNIMEAKGIDMTVARTIAKGVIDSAPAVDVMPAAHGRWIDADTRTGHHLLTQCSECSFGFYGDVCYWAYCPVCGSKMDGDTNA